MRKLISIGALAMSTASTDIASAQTYSADQNPYTLVYEGAIKENVEGKVHIHPVSYKIGDMAISANVYTPPNYDTRKNILR